MEIKVTETFQYEGEEYEKGKVVSLPEKVAERVVEKGYGEPIEKETPTLDVGEEKRKRGPRWKRKIWISEDRNLSVSIWPPGGRFDSPSLTLEENRKDDSGDWESNRLYLPTGSSLLALSEHLKTAWNEVQKIRAEEKK